MGLVHVVFDEFLEITERPGALAIEGVLRGHILRRWWRPPLPFPTGGDLLGLLGHR